MIDEPYRLVEAISNRREYIENELATGSPTIGLRGCLKSPDSVKFGDYTRSFQLPNTWAESYARTVSVEISGLFKHPLTHTTILRWVQRYVPEFEKRWNRYARPVGHTVDFLLSRRRDIAAAKRFFSRATRQHGVPRVITLDGAVAKLKEVGTLPRRDGCDPRNLKPLTGKATTAPELWAAVLA